MMPLLRGRCGVCRGPAVALLCFDCVDSPRFVASMTSLVPWLTYPSKDRTYKYVRFTRHLTIYVGPGVYKTTL